MNMQKRRVESIQDELLVQEVHKKLAFFRQEAIKTFLLQLIHSRWLFYFITSLAQLTKLPQFRSTRSPLNGGGGSEAVKLVEFYKGSKRDVKKKRNTSFRKAGRMSKLRIFITKIE